MKGMPHYLVLGLIGSYIYWLIFRIDDLNDNFFLTLDAYMGWLTVKQAESKPMGIIILCLLLGLILVMVFSPNNVNEYSFLLGSIALGWFGSKQQN
jgi:ABC-type transport system involved in cytochrome c biogenesis permease subunit